MLKGSPVHHIATALAVAAGVVVAASGKSDASFHHDIVIHPYIRNTTADAFVRNYWTPDRISNIDHDPFGTNHTPNANVNSSTGQAYLYGGAVESTVGRLLFRQYNPQNQNMTASSCSATLVESANQATIVTAAHCVYAPLNSSDSILAQGWSDNILWIPGFHDGRSRLENFTVNTALISHEWEDTAGVKDIDDRAYLVLNTDRHGRAPGQTLGPGQKIAFHADAPRAGMEVWQLGYPRYLNSPQRPDPRQGSPAFTGRALASCNGTLFPFFAVPDELGTVCYMGGGCSGGPAFADFDTKTGRGTIVGINTISLGRQTSGNISVYLFDTNVTSTPSKELWSIAQSMAVLPLTGSEYETGTKTKA